QSALAAVREHLATAPPPGQGILGFLVGDLCECPDTNVSYLVIDAALRLSQPIYGDRTTDVVTRIWDRIVAQAEEQKGHLIGWYHTHAPLPVSMSAHDIETHEHYFAEPWQVALVLGSDAGGQPIAGFFRAGAKVGRGGVLDAGRRLRVDAAATRRSPGAASPPAPALAPTSTPSAAARAAA